MHDEQLSRPGCLHGDCSSELHSVHPDGAVLRSDRRLLRAVKLLRNDVLRACLLWNDDVLQRELLHVYKHAGGDGGPASG
jgi:hypothetical protein